MYHHNNQTPTEQRVLYYSLKCPLCRALVDELKHRPDVAAQLQSVDCTNLVTSTGTKCIVHREDGSSLEVPFTITGLPAIEFVAAPNVPYRRPIIGLTAVAVHLGLAAPAAPAAVAAGAAAPAGTAAAGPAAAAPVASAPMPASAASLGGPASFVPSAPTHSVARP